MKTKNFFSLSSIALLIPLLLTVSCGEGGGGNGTYNPRNPYGLGPKAISLSKDGKEVAASSDLGSAGNYAILAKTGISDDATNVTRITGNIGVSPIVAAAITNFALVADGTNRFSTSTKVIGGGRVYAANYAVPTPSNMTTSIGSMETAYTDGQGRTNPDHTELHAGDLSAKTLTPDLYKWSNNVVINTDVHLDGSPTDVWIFQIAGNLDIATGVRVILDGGALPQNIFWLVAGNVTVEVGAHMEGIVMSQTAVVLKTGASMNGRIFAQTAVTLDENEVTQP
ncbi:MAG: DUF3494 domain-containing protein [Bdellovibrionales bacterium]|nr:DUF3494 domain-containing protein [Bdellovibrionales bacterium]